LAGNKQPGRLAFGDLPKLILSALRVSGFEAISIIITAIQLAKPVVSGKKTAKT